MKTVDGYVVAYREAVQAHVTDEQVLAVGILSRPGSLANAFMFKVNDAAALFQNGRGRSASGNLPQNVAVAVTPTRLLFFSFKPKMTSIVVKDRVREVARQGLRVTAAGGSFAARLTFHLADGSSFELDSNRNVGQYQRLNEAFLTELAVTPA